MATTSSDSPPNLDFLLGEVRRLTDDFKAGNRGSFQAFRDLVALLLGRTVLAPGQAPRLVSLRGSPDLRVLGGTGGATSPLRLANGHYLKLIVHLALSDTEHGPRLKVISSSYQYQLDELGATWVFRYDYWREAPVKHPAAHLHVRSTLLAPARLDHEGMLHERVHYPTGRLSIKAVIRLLIEQYSVVPVTPAHIWRPLLHASETAFQEIAHKPDLLDPRGSVE